MSTHAFGDADQHAGNVVTRRSQTGCLLARSFGTAKRQNTVETKVRSAVLSSQLNGRLWSWWYRYVTSYECLVYLSRDQRTSSVMTTLARVSSMHIIIWGLSHMVPRAVAAHEDYCGDC